MAAMPRPIGEVLLFSSGIDSLITSKRFPNAQKLYIDIGSKYAAKEISYIRQHYDDVIIDRRLTLADMEREDAIVPARNLFLVSIASLYGSRIILNAVNGDGSTDKDGPFSIMLSRLLSHIYSPPHFDGSPVSVSLPMRDMSKNQWVKWYLDHGHDPAELANAISCYHPEHAHCGLCKACIRKWIALEDNGVILTPWNTHPSEYDWEPHLEAIRNQSWRCVEESRAAARVLRRYGII